MGDFPILAWYSENDVVGTLLAVDASVIYKIRKPEKNFKADISTLFKMIEGGEL
jgi:hypothetical protein